MAVSFLKRHETFATRRALSSLVERKVASVLLRCLRAAAGCDVHEIMQRVEEINYFKTSCYASKEE